MLPFQAVPQASAVLFSQVLRCRVRGMPLFSALRLLCKRSPFNRSQSTTRQPLRAAVAAQQFEVPGEVEGEAVAAAQSDLLQ